MPAASGAPIPGRGASPDYSRAIATHTLQAFATPIINYLWQDAEDLNAALAAVILEAEGSTEGLTRSNVGGWHSDLRFLERREPCITALRTRLHDFVADLNRAVFRNDANAPAEHFIIDAWANVMRRGHYHSPHRHPNAFWSGVYYVTGNPPVAGQPSSGKLELFDPRPGADLNYAEGSSLSGRFLLCPSPGQMIIFPSWLEHWVHPYHGDDARLSIAFNVRLGQAAQGDSD
jgi:uncharacterized protein (TIGR02466 family)